MLAAPASCGGGPSAPALSRPSSRTPPVAASRRGACRANSADRSADSTAPRSDGAAPGASNVCGAASLPATSSVSSPVAAASAASPRAPVIPTSTVVAAQDPAPSTRSFSAALLGEPNCNSVARAAPCNTTEATSGTQQRRPARRAFTPTSALDPSPSRRDAIPGCAAAADPTPRSPQRPRDPRRTPQCPHCATPRTSPHLTHPVAGSARAGPGLPSRPREVETRACALRLRSASALCLSALRRAPAQTPARNKTKKPRLQSWSRGW